MRVQVLGPARWAAEGLAAALARAPAASAIEVAQPSAPDPDVIVAMAVDEATLRALERQPASVAVLLLGAVPAGALARLGHGARPLGWLPADADDERIRAAVAALALGLDVHAPGAPRGLSGPLADLQELQEPLTARELEVFELLAKGLGNREIAAALGISHHTAKFHVGQILEKTGSATRVEAVRQGLRMGIVGL